ncbi:MAG: DUF6261 family protein [Odoribacteraceae bacterium]|nr:DUF6261 family protein [Odoribacteraceae bacterium]
MLKKTFSRLTTEALATLVSETIKIVTDTSDATFTAHPLFTEIIPLYDDYFSVLNKSTFSGMGRELVEIDKRRDEMYRGIRDIFRGQARFKDLLPEGTTATELLPLFNEVERVRKMSARTYAEETAAIEYLCTRLFESDNAGKVASLGLTSQCTMLQETNREFSEAYLRQVSANAAIRQRGTATGKRGALEAAMKDFYMLVASMKDIEPWPALHATLEELQARTH